MLNMFRMLIHSSSGAYDLCVELFRGLHWSGSMCVGVTLWYGCGGVVSVCRLKQCFSLHTDYIDLVRCVLELHCGMSVVVWYPYAGWSSASTCIRITLIWFDVTHEIIQHISRKFLRMDVLTSETCWTLYKEIIKQVTSSWSLFTQLSRWCTVQYT